MKTGIAVRTFVNRPGTILIIILFFGLLIRFIEMAGITSIELDGTAYANIGDLWSKGAFREALRSIFPPVFPLLIGVFHLIIPDLECAGRTVSLVSGVLLIYIAFLFLKKFWGERVALYGATLIALHPYLVRNSTLVLSESTATLLFASTIFLFYRGLKEDRAWDIGFSGLLLSLTYLTRPEFIVYFAPLSILLIIRKRYSHTVLFLVCFFLLVGIYMYYLKTETGLLVVSKKAILVKEQHASDLSHRSHLLPIMPVRTMFHYAPQVAFHFFEALFIPIGILIFLGFNKIDGQYRILMILLAAFHVLSLATMGATSRRFSVEFVPLMVPFAVEGLFVVERFWERFKRKRILWYGTIGIIVAISLFQSFTSPDGGRLLHKRAGLYLLSLDPGHPVLSRLPIVSFYSKGGWVHIMPLTEKDAKCSKLPEVAAKGNARYFAVDDVMEKELPFLKNCVYGLPLIIEIRDGDDFIKIYRLDNNG
jgi:4-amino-4-deoxy-L-arabinose transferase-like glycosyltransferase